MILLKKLRHLLIVLARKYWSLLRRKKSSFQLTDLLHRVNFKDILNWLFFKRLIIYCCHSSSLHIDSCAFKPDSPDS